MDLRVQRGMGAGSQRKIVNARSRPRSFSSPPGTSRHVVHSGQLNAQRRYSQRKVSMPQRRRSPAAKPAELPDNPISRVVPLGDRRDSLIAIRDRLAFETDDLKWSKHRAECHCVCGMTDPRALVALGKELRAVLDAIAALPEGGKRSALDDIVASVAQLDDARRTRRRAAAAGAPGT